MTETADPDLAPDLLREMEQMAVELAKLAAVEIEASLGRTLEVRYKPSASHADAYRDPVSEVDHRTEVLIRARLEERFPTHGILGEEIAPKRTGQDFVWALDPIDGTTNFVNGFPLFAASVGLLYRGRPLVGAVWCSTSHALRPGVYHARQGSQLFFDGEALELRANPAVRRQLGGEPPALAASTASWDSRKTGSAAIECAFVAAGLLAVARFERPNVWDVAGGLALVEAVKLSAQTCGPEGWAPFSGFLADGSAGFNTWRQSVVIGHPQAVREMVGLTASR